MGFGPAMTKDAVKMAKQAGFRFSHFATNHQIWKHPSGLRLTLPRGAKISPRHYNEVKVTCKRASEASSR